MSDEKNAFPPSDGMPLVLQYFLGVTRHVTSHETRDWPTGHLAMRKVRENHALSVRLDACLSVCLSDVYVVGSARLDT